jgi:flagellar biosynthesis/type III secretory pathway M-ring protein FliF/YscJ
MDETRCPQRRCGEPAEQISAVQVALLVIVAAILVFYVARSLGRLRSTREKFASKRAHEVHKKAQEVFRDGGGDARYSDYKNKVPGADPVQYNDVRRLFKAGKMSPYTIESVM